MLKFLVVNAYGIGNNTKKEFANWAASFDVDYVIMSESVGMEPYMTAVGFHFYGAGNKSRGRRDVSICSSRELHEDDAKQLSRDLDRMVAPDRWVKWGRRFNTVPISFHNNAYIQKDDGGFRLWVVGIAARLAFRRLGKLIGTFQSAQRKVFLGMDANWRKKKGSDVTYSPEWLARTYNLAYVTIELMWAMWDKEYFELVTYRSIPGHDVPTGTRDDHPHPALLVTLRRKK